LRDVLGLDEARIEALIARGAVACHDPAPPAAKRQVAE
jgi:hypothetical protein